MPNAMQMTGKWRTGLGLRGVLGSVLAGLILLCATALPARPVGADVIHPVDHTSSALLMSYPPDMRNAAYTMYRNLVKDYVGMTPDRIVQQDKQTHGSGHLFLGLHELMADGSEEKVWAHIRTARAHGSLFSMVLFGYAFENGVAGYHQRLDHAAKNFRSAAKPTFYRALGNNTVASKVVNHGSSDDLARFLRRHPEQQLFDGEADMAAERMGILWIGALNMRVNGAKMPDEPLTEEGVTRMVDYVLALDEENATYKADMRLKLSDLLISSPLLDAFANRRALAFRLRESVYRDFPESFERDMLVNAALGSSYLKGIGVEKNIDRAIMHFRVAAEEGHVVSALNLAVISLDNNHDVTRNGRDLLYLLMPFTGQFETLSAKHRADVAYVIGVIHGNGYEVPADLDAQYFWSRLGHDFQRRPGIGKWIDDYHATLTRTQRAEHEEDYQAFRRSLGLERSEP